MAAVGPRCLLGLLVRALAVVVDGVVDAGLDVDGGDMKGCIQQWVCFAH
jgi:hypothetical protein